MPVEPGVEDGGFVIADDQPNLVVHAVDVVYDPSIFCVKKSTNYLD